MLYVGYDYPFDSKNKESFVHSKNIITEELIYRRAEDMKLKVKAASENQNKVRIIASCRSRTIAARVSLY